MVRSEQNTKFAPASRRPNQVVEAARFKLAEHVCSRYFDFFPVPLIVLNDCRQIVLSNKSFMESLGLPDMDGFLGKRPGEALSCVYSDIEPGGCGTSEFCRECGAVQAIMESITTNSTACRDCQLLSRNSGSTGARDLRLMVSPWSIDDETYYVATITDIADEKRRRALERIFFHDILNAAGGAKGLTDLLIGETEGSTKETIGLIQTSLFALIEEVQKQKQLLAVENKEYASLPITLQGLELIELLASRYAAHPSALGKRIEVAQDSANVAAVADYTLLMRVLANMLLNALEATKPDGVVVIGLKEDNRQAMFWVKNDKVMPEKVRLQIFKRSFSTKGGDRGLGTYSIKLLTENYLGGEVGFVSAEPVGTTFWIRVPKAPA